VTGDRYAHRIVGGKTWVVPAHEKEGVSERRPPQCAAALKVIRKACKQHRVAVQAGGNWGYWPYCFAEVFDTVYTFEPGHETFACLAANTRHQPNLVRIQAALGDRHGPIGVVVREGSTGSQKVSGPGIFPMMRIDDLELPVCDLIYLDIEGMEVDALKGAVHTISRCQPVVAFENNKNGAQSMIKSFGYHRADANPGSNDELWLPSI
jgi:FkbM family methyltransferase